LYNFLVGPFLAIEVFSSEITDHMCTFSKFQVFHAFDGPPRTCAQIEEDTHPAETFFEVPPNWISASYQFKGEPIEKDV